MLPLTNRMMAGNKTMEVGLPVFLAHRLANMTAMMVPIKLPRLLPVIALPSKTPP